MSSTEPESESRPEEQSGREPPSRPSQRNGALLLLALMVALWFIVSGSDGIGEPIPYSEFKQRLAAGEVVDCRVEDTKIHGTIAHAADEPDGEPVERRFRTVRIDDPDLVQQLEAAGIEFSGVEPSSFSPWLLIWALPLGLLLVFWLFAYRRLRGLGTPGGAAMGFGRHRAKLVADLDTGVTFEDVAGCDEAKTDLVEIVDFLRNPERYVKLGAAIPRGVLLLGPPGTGKTLLARAIAGEAKVPFFQISGSDFVEMFVGVGAARVRDLFEQAKKTAPCIVFIDEIDAVGRTRGVHIASVNDEREQTLNQLLVELDGFEPNSGVILLAATNRPDVLDRALLRPGRFDRRVILDVPDIRGRKAILEVHARGKPLAEGVDLDAVARTTPGFAGADLANALNEAALLAARRGAAAIEQDDLEDAVERAVAGPERKSRRLREDERRRVAYHESGHAIVARSCEHADPVHKVSIVPRGGAALGFTMQLPEEDQAVLTRGQLDDRITGLLGGRAAEEIVFDEVSTGAANDLEQATALAREMVCRHGMGESAGLMHCAHDPSWLPEWGPGGNAQRDCSEDTASAIDAEVQRMLEHSYERAKELLRGRSEQLERMAETLLEHETLDADAIDQLLGSDDGS